MALIWVTLAYFAASGLHFIVPFNFYLSASSNCEYTVIDAMQNQITKKDLWKKEWFLQE